MNIFQVIRAPEWWEYKMPPVLGVGYATAFYLDIPISKIAPQLLFFLASLAVGAVYVSLINDITDIKADLAAGKPNRMTKIPYRLRSLFPLCCVITGLIFGYFMWPDLRTVSLYVAAWVVFSLYSIPPFRFKERGLLGVICDASGAHLFPTCLIVSGLYYVSGVPLDIAWFALVAVWSLCFGLRGILWHQFLDRANDLATHTETFATGIEPDKFSRTAWTIFLMEVAAFIGFTQMIQLSLTPFLLAGYILLVWIRYRRYDQQPILILMPESRPFQVLMLDYYQVFFPIGILIAAASDQLYGWLVLVTHLLLFPHKVSVVVRDFVKAVLKL